MAKQEDVITAVEIGTGAIKVMMGRPLDDGTMLLTGFHETPSLGRVVKGEATNVPAVEELLHETLSQAESKSGERIGSIYLAVTGGHIESTNIRGTVPITAADRTITEEDVIEATRNARNYQLPVEQSQVHSLQRSFIIDSHRRTNKPIGIIGNQLTADIHLIYGQQNNIQTTCRLVDDAQGYPAQDVAFSGIADIYGVSLGNEMGSGFLLIDIGAGVTEYVLFYDNGCMHSGQITVGCDQIANDISIGLQLPIAKCRDIIRKHGSALTAQDTTVTDIPVRVNMGEPERRIRMAPVHQIMELRLRELFEVILADLHEHDLANLIGENVILCGGGALIPHITDLADIVFSRKAIIGRPGNVSGDEKAVDSPRCVTTVGLLHLGHQMQQIDRRSTMPLTAIVRRDFLKMVDLFKRSMRI